MRVIGGLLVAGIGVAMIFYSSSLTKMFGRRARAENNLWGTMQGIIILGFIIIVIGIMMIFGGQFVQPDPTWLQLK